MRKGAKRRGKDGRGSPVPGPGPGLGRQKGAGVPGLGPGSTVNDQLIVMDVKDETDRVSG